MTTPKDVCFNCWERNTKGKLSKKTMQKNWERAANGCAEWRCPVTIEMAKCWVEQYPPLKCPMRLELLLLKNENHDRPEKVIKENLRGGY